MSRRGHSPKGRSPATITASDDEETRSSGRSGSRSRSRSRVSSRSSPSSSRSTSAGSRDNATQIFPKPRGLGAGNTTIATTGDELATDASEWRTFIESRDKILFLDSLVWDAKAQFGQNRKLKGSIVAYYVQRLLTGGDPVRPVNVLVKATPGMHPPSLRGHPR